MMDTFKSIMGTLAVILTFIGYVPYLKDTIRGKTKPHVYSWFIWGFEAAIVFGLQMSQNAGPGAFVTLAASLISFTIATLGLKNGKKIIKPSDTLFFTLSIVALGCWLIAKQPLISTLLITSTGLLGFIPTVRKSWNQPYSETVSTYVINTVRHSITLLSLENYNLITYLYPAAWVALNGFFALMLIIRRKQLPQTN